MAVQTVQDYAVTNPELRAAGKQSVQQGAGGGVSQLVSASQLQCNPKHLPQNTHKPQEVCVTQRIFFSSLFFFLPLTSGSVVSICTSEVPACEQVISGGEAIKRRARLLGSRLLRSQNGRLICAKWDSFAWPDLNWTLFNYFRIHSPLESATAAV